MVSEIENLNPNVYRKSDDRKSAAADWDDNVEDPFDEREVFGKYFELNLSKNFSVMFFLVE